MEGFPKPKANTLEMISQTKAQKIESIKSQIDRHMLYAHDPEVQKTIDSLNSRLQEVLAEPDDVVISEPEVSLVNNTPVDESEMM